MNTDGVGATIEDLLAKIADLLDTHGQPDWARAFRSFLSEFEIDPSRTQGEIRSVYGGMGSFNYVVLHGPGGMPLRKVNDELDRMRAELFRLCQ